MSRVITWSVAVVIMAGAGVIFLSEKVTGTASVATKTEQMSGATRVDPAQLSMEGPNFKQWTAENPNGNFGAPPKVKPRAKRVASASKPSDVGAPTWEQWTKQPSGDFSAGAVATTPRFTPRVSYAR